MEEDLRTIKQCWKSLLYNDNEPWTKKDTYSCFDVTMGSYDGAEICELVGTHLLSLLANTVDKKDCGLYRDDGLIILRKTNRKKMERIRKSVINIFKDVSFKNEVKSNLKIVPFLDVTFNLSNECYSPYKKPNYNLLHVNTSSNYPPQIIKMLQSSTNERLSKNPSNETIFNISKVDYEKAHKESGYKSADLKYAKTTEKRYHNRNRNIIWFNLPFNKDVSTNVAKKNPGFTT